MARSWGTESTPSESIKAGTKMSATQVEGFAARGIDDSVMRLTSLELLNEMAVKVDQVSRGQAAAGIEKYTDVRHSAESITRIAEMVQRRRAT